MFNAKKVCADCAAWIAAWFEQNGKSCAAIVGISGGKDSSVVAALCVKALGADRVFGVLMPNGVQPDIDTAHALCAHLGIKNITVNIEDAVNSVLNELGNTLPAVSDATRINVQPRIRMAVTYAAAQSLNGRVANTCNLSEDYVGYATRYGDGVGDFSPLSKLTVAEVKALGYELGLPKEFVEKLPIDGLCGKSDEENLGFSYEVLDKYIRTGVCEDAVVKQRIDTLNRMNKFKLELMQSFPYEP